MLTCPSAGRSANFVLVDGTSAFIVSGVVVIVHTVDLVGSADRVVLDDRVLVTSTERKQSTGHLKQQ